MCATAPVSKMYQRFPASLTFAPLVFLQVDLLPDLASVNWNALGTQALHAAVTGITRMRTALEQGILPQGGEKRNFA